MTKNNNVQEPEINVGEALSKTEKFFETYKKPMLYTIAAIVIIFNCLNRNKAKNANASEEKEEKDND